MKRGFVLVACVALASIMASVFVEGPASGQVQVQGPASKGRGDVVWPPRPDQVVSLAGSTAPLQPGQIEAIYTAPLNRWVVLTYVQVVVGGANPLELLRMKGSETQVLATESNVAYISLGFSDIGVPLPPGWQLAIRNPTALPHPQDSRWFITGYIEKPDQRKTEWPPHADDLVGEAGAVAMQAGSPPEVIFDVPSDRWFVATTLTTNPGNTEEVVEIHSGVATTRKHSHQSIRGLRHGLPFRPGSQVALRMTAGGTATVSWQLFGYFVNE